MKKGKTVEPFPTRRTTRLLIVEDEPVDAELAVKVLQRAGYPLTFEVIDSAPALDERLAHADYDAILCDHNLQTWTGLDALKILKKSGKEIPFLVLTAVLGDEAAVEYVKQGATDYVLKRHLERLPVALRRALREKTHREEAAQLQELIALAKRDWELTFDSVPDAIMLVDEVSCIRRVNRALIELLGLEFSQVIGKHCYEVMHRSDKPPQNCPHRRLLETGMEARADIEEPWLGKIFDHACSPLRDSSGALVGSVVVLRDITERQRLEEQLRQAQKMEAVGRLAGGVAHDFNNLLTVIIGYSDFMLGKLPDSDRLYRPLAEIKRAAERAASLTRRLLAFSRKQVLQPQILDLTSVLESAYEMLRRMIGEDIELVMNLSPALGHVKADPGHIEQVIMNLAVNARDAMPQGGQLTLEAANVELDASCVSSHEGVRPGPYVMLAVSDTGIGMDAKTQAHMFEPFFTTKEQGSGLGLATVYGIVKQSGGDVWVYSELGKGTTFKVYLPRIEQAVGVVEAGDRRAEEGPQGSENILLVEDEEAVRCLVKETLENKGYEVLEAKGAHEALEVVDRHKEAIHLLLTDVVMPQISGTELAKLLAPLHPETKVLYMSGYTESAAFRQSLLDPGTPVLQKPFTLDALTRKLREVLGSAVVRKT
jgi:PAS domain S-box-containing protein